MSHIFGSYHRDPGGAPRPQAPDNSAYLRERRIYAYDSPEAGVWKQRFHERLQRGEALYLLGFQTIFHNSGISLVEASLAKGLRVLANYEEERFSGKKHFAGYPVHCIAEVKQLLQSLGRTASDLFCVCHGWDVIALERNAQVSSPPANDFDTYLTFSVISDESHEMAHRPKRKNFYLYSTLFAELYERLLVDLEAPAATPCFQLTHHENHAYFSYGSSPFYTADPHDPGTLIVCVDGGGDSGSSSFFRAQQGKVELIKRCPMRDSLGHFYTLTACFLGGWTTLSSEGRYMGAAAWGNNDRLTNPYYPRLRQYFYFGPKGEVHTNEAMSAPTYEGLQAVLGAFLPVKELWNPDAVLNVDNIAHSEITRDRVDKAAAVQMVLEDALFHIIGWLIQETGLNRLVFCGGVALNCVANMRLVDHFDESYFRRYLGKNARLELWVPPIPSDQGVVVGAPYQFALRNGAPALGCLPTPFLCGLPPTSRSIRTALGKAPNLEVLELGNANDDESRRRIADWMAYVVSKDGVIGIFQGEAETGPRALGHRSLLSNPRNPDTLEVLNGRVKRREKIRPLAPMVTLKEAARWFKLSPGASAANYSAYDYMVLTAEARDEAKIAIPAVIHYDGTSRIQIVRKENNALIHDYLEALGRRIGVEVSVNTSLNVGSPIVQTPEQALEVFNRAKGLDGLVMVGSDGEAFMVWAKVGKQQCDSRVPQMWREFSDQTTGGDPASSNSNYTPVVDSLRDRQRLVLRALKEKQITVAEAREQLRILDESAGAPVGEPISAWVKPDSKDAHTAPRYANGNGNGHDSRHEASEKVAVDSKKTAATFTQPTTEPIAVIGMSGRFPGARTIAEFWANLRNGVDSVGEIPRERWPIDEFFDPVPGKQGKIYCRAAGMLDGVDEFDPLFFNISPREAVSIDPQYRLLLQEMWGALEDAGHRASAYSGEKVGVFVGGGVGDYPGRSAHLPSTEASRLSYLFDWKGPCVCVETSCSSGLVAVHEACLHLQTGRLRMAIVGSASLYNTPYSHVGFSQMNMLSPEGKCFSFDRRADGTVFSEAVCAVVLKPLSAAIADHDHIYGVIKGSNTNYDGKTNGITSPSGASQTALEVETYQRYGIDPGQITMMEAHGTGTKLGDPVEVNALIKAFRQFSDKKEYCALGAVKSNIGHTASAAGLVGLIKVLLSLKHRQIPPTLHFSDPNPEIAFAGSPFVVNTSLKNWSVPAGTPRLAAVSSFGVGGTNAHAVVEEWIEHSSNPVPNALTPRPAQALIIPLSAKNADRLKASAATLAGYLRQRAGHTGTNGNGNGHANGNGNGNGNGYANGNGNGSALSFHGDELRLEDVAYTAQIGRESMESRIAFVARDIPELVSQLEAFLAGKKRVGEIFLGEEKADRSFAAFFNSQDSRDWISRWIEKDELGKIAELWARGVDIDWTVLHVGRCPARVSLPTYPFVRDRYWASESPLGQVTVAAPVPLGELASVREIAAPTASPSLLITTDEVRPLTAPRRSPPLAGPEDVAPVAEPRKRISLRTPAGNVAPARSPEVPKPVVCLAPQEARPSALPKQQSPRVEKPVPTARVSTEALEDSLAASLAEALFMKPADVDRDKKFTDLGLDSIVGVEWIRTINQRHGLSIPATKVYDYPTIREFAEYLDALLREAPSAVSVLESEPSQQAAPIDVPPKMLAPRTIEAPPAPDAEELEGILVGTLADALFMKRSDVDLDKKFIDLGLDSIVGVEWIRTVNQKFGLALPATKVYDHPTVRELAVFLSEELKKKPLAPAPEGAALSSGLTNGVAQSKPASQSGPTPGLAPSIPTTGVGSQVKAPQSKTTRTVALRAPDLVKPISRPAATAPLSDGSGGFGLVVSTTHTFDEMRLQPWTVPAPAAGELTIQVKASAVNFPDAMCIKGLYPTMPEYPFVPGFEVAGVVLKTGSGVTGFKPGDEVVALTGDRLGGHATYVNVPAATSVRKPRNLTFEEAASLPVVFGTVHYAFQLGQLAPGEHVLIQTATGGCGLMALQLARLQGCVCYGTSSREEKLAILRRLQVAAAINYKTVPFDREIMRLTGNRGVDVVLNMLSGDGIQKGLNCLAPSGRYLELASHALHTSSKLDLSRLVQNQTIHSIDLRKLAFKKQLPTGKIMEIMTDLVESGRLVPIVSRIYPLARIREAMEYVGTGRHIGKVIISHTQSEVLDLQDQCIARLLDQKRQCDTAPRQVDSRITVPGGQIVPSILEPKSVIPEGIAIVGMSGRFPQSNTLTAFWENLAKGACCVTEVPPTRWPMDRYYDPKPRVPGKTDCKWMGVLDDVDRFDPLFFSIPPAEAEWMDPQQRVFLESCWHCLEDAGLRPSRLSGTRCGVFVGCTSGDYGRGSGMSGVHPQGLMGGAMSVLAGRVSYLLNLQGPCLAIDTACSSSLVAISGACDSLILKNCDSALAGGVCVNAGPGLHLMAGGAGMLSRDGRCFTFDSRANGFVPGEGVGVLLLKRLSDALRDNDQIHGVIRGWGVNQDGKTNGITAPSVKSQVRLETEIYSRFGINPETITLAEAHGTGTKLGDPIEVEALTTAFRNFTPKKHFCALGSVKSNIGHLLTAAGVSGAIKVLLALKHGQVPPAANFETLNEHLRLDDSPFYVNTKLSPWNPAPGAPRRATVSSFGFSGTNAHIVIEEFADGAAQAPGLDSAKPSEPLVWVLSAKSEDRLRVSTEQLLAYVASGRHANLRDVASTLQMGREPMNHRLAFVADSKETVERCLKDYIGNVPSTELFRSPPGLRERPARSREDSGKQAAIRSWVEKKDLSSLARAWVEGADVEWLGLYSGGAKPGRISLPAYPFARERYWIEDSPPDSAGGVEKPSEQVPELLGEPVKEVATAHRTMFLVPRWEEQSLNPSRIADWTGDRLVVLCGGTEEAARQVEDGLANTRCLVLPNTAGSTDQRFDLAFERVFQAVKAVLEQPSPKELLVQVLHGSEGAEALFAGLSGLLKSAHIENPKILGQDLEGECLMESSDGILTALRAADGLVREPRIRFSQGRVALQRWDQVPVVSGTPFVWREGGVYLITGGAGGIAIQVALEIAKRAAKVRLILIGRSAPGPVIAKHLEILASCGAMAEYLNVDCSNAVAVASLVQRIVREHGGLNGVLHCAGQTRDGFILKKQLAEAKNVLAPKVAGVVNLDAATRDLDLDCVVFFSSVAAVRGNVGQADYATANAFMDAYATYRNKLAASGERRGNAFSINWPLWEEGGMHVDQQSRHTTRKNLGLSPLPTTAALAALKTILGSSQSQVMVLHGDPNWVTTKAEPNLSTSPSKSGGTEPDLDAAALLESTVLGLRKLVGETIKLNVERVDPDEPLEAYGIDSILIASLNEKLAPNFSELPKTLWYEHRTLRAIGGYLAQHHPVECGRWQGIKSSRESERVTAPPQTVMATPTAPVSRVPALEPRPVSTEPIAIIGLSGRYPGAESLDQFWENLKSGTLSIGELPLVSTGESAPQKRWTWPGFGNPNIESGAAVSAPVVRGGFLESFAAFDSLFFNLSPAEAINMDPQERLLLTSCWEAMEDAGHSRGSLRGSCAGAVGVFVGVTKSGFRLHTQLESTWEASRFPVTSFSSMANRISYHLNLTGPSLAIDTMCSSSLTAIHEACEHIRRGDCRMALAAGVNLYSHPRDYIDLLLGRMVTSEPEVHCFAKDGGGFIPGEGVGAVLLKPLSLAIADGDPIHGVIRGSAIRHGGKTHGYTVPSVTEEREVIRQALARAECAAGDISYIESAANGSSMGDAIEFEALRQVFEGRAPQSCLVGTIKPSIGHLEAASGISQLTKVLLQMKHQTLAPTRIDGARLDPALPWARSPLKLVTEAVSWPASVTSPTRALVTSFGAGGSYAALVVESYSTVSQTPEPVPTAPELFILSARTGAQLRQSAGRLAAYLLHGKVDLASLAYTLQQGREPLDYRLAVSATDASTLAKLLQAVSCGEKPAEVRFGRQSEIVALKEVLSTADLRTLVAQAAAQRDLESVAKFWVKGVDEIPWNTLYRNPPRRCSAPTYPFEPRTLWYDFKPSVAGPFALPPIVKSHREATSYTGEGIVIVEHDRIVPRAGSPAGLVEIKRSIVGIIRGILLLRDEDEIREDCTFFELGLDSITSARMVQRLSVELGRDLPETLFFDFPTMKALADHLAGGTGLSPSSSVQRMKTSVGVQSVESGMSLKARLQMQMKRFDEVVAFQVEGDGPVLFCVHPMSGDVGLHGKLADAAKTDFRVVALKSRGASGALEPLTEIESMGRYLADIITGIDPDGPYWLFAPSMGGAVIHEIARQLQLRNKRVAALIMIEPPLMNNDQDAELWDTTQIDNWLMTANFILITYLHMNPEFRRKKAAGEVLWSNLEIRRDELVGTENDAVVPRLVELIRSRGVTQAADVLESRLRTMSDVHLANLRALKRYRAEPLPLPNEVRAILLRTRDGSAVADEMYNPLYLVELQKAQGGILSYFKDWDRLYPKLETRIIEGRNHLDLLNTRKAAQEIADLIKEVVAAAGGTPSLTKPGAQPKVIPPAAGTATRIAIIGIAGQFASARNMDEFWDLLREGRGAWSEFPQDRGWNTAQIFAEGAGLHRSYVRSGGFLQDALGFDAAFFGISPREAEMMDPSERLFLMESWKAIEDAGIDPAGISGAKWGVFCGGGGDYNLRMQELYGASPNVTVSSFAGRVAYSLNLKGPAASIDAGCASSLLAVANACDQLQLGRCDTALAGGVLVYSTPNLILTSCRNELFSRDQVSRALDERANGMMPGEAVGVLILKRLDDAVRDGNRIHGVIEAWGSNHNGRTNGLASPSASAQAELFTQVYREFGVDPATIGLMEANATATRLGDTVEIQALTAAFREFTDKARFCVLGSVENNVGHAFQASGMCHLAKVLLALRHHQIPVSPQVETRNRALDSAESPFVVPTAPIAWNVNDGQVRRAAISSFGATGVNVHVVISEPPSSATVAPIPAASEAGAKSPGLGGAPGAGTPPSLICLSARSREALLERCRDLRDFLLRPGAPDNARRVAANLWVRQVRLPHRCALVVESCSILAEQLTKVLDGQNLDSGFMGSSPGTLSPATEALGRRALAALSGGRSGFAELLDIANLYVQGFVPEASLLFSRQERTPLSLPAYPFEKRPCWIGLDQPVAQKMAFDSVGRTGSSATSLIAEIQRLVCECTGLETARVELQFTWTEMGLESMACLRLLAALNERFSLELQLADLIEYNNVQSLKAYIESNSPSASARPSSEHEKSAPAVGSGDWIARRLSLVPGTIHVRSESIPGETALVPSLETCEPALAKLTTGGVAIYHGGSACHFFAHASVDIASVLAGLSKTERDALSTRLPTSLLFGPISQEQERNLFHSEVLRQAAWNLQHTFTWTDGALDLKRLDLALAAVAESQDIIKTYYHRLGETWIQVVQPEAVLRCERVEAALVEDFQGLVVQAKSQLLALDRAPVFRVLVAAIDDKWYLGVITHHSLADAFSSAMLMAEVERHYRTLATGGSLSPRPLEEQYWQYALEQFDAKTVHAESSRLFWESQFAGVGIANRLPYSVDPSSVSPELLPSAQARVVSLSSEDTSALVRFCKSQQTTLTQVFAAAVAMLCGPGLAQERAVFQYVNSQRNQWRLLKTLGEFTNVLFLPLKASLESSLMDCVRQVNASTLDALRHARFGFKDLLTLAGLKGYESYYGQLDNIVIDTVDFDAAEAASNANGWRSISARVWADERVSGMEGQALATWFFQVVKVHDAVHLIASYRKHLFSPETMAEVCRLILDFVREIIRRPEVKVGEVLRNNQESLLGLQVLAERSLARAVRTESSEVTQPRSTLVTRRASLPRECQRLNRVKSGRPVFWIHAGLGGVEAYQIFAQRSSRPFFGIHARGWMDEQPAIEGLDAMAAHYFDIIRSVQGGGLYDLGGYSLGGLLSYEITRLAQESGETVDSIVMLDSLDSVSLKRIHLSAKSDMLQTVNTALMVSAQGTAGGLSSSLIHKDELDATLDDVVFLERLIGVARGRGLTLSDRQIKTLVRRRSKVQQGYRPMDFHLKPLPHPAEVSVHYFRNRSGLFLGELGPYYTLPGDRIDLDHFEYWAEWSRELPKLRIVDVPARSHGTFLSDLGVTQVIGDFCERLYSGLGEETGA